MIVDSLRSFFDYIKANPESECSFTALCRASEIETAPTNDISLPGGTVALFPEYLVFLTLDRFKQRSRLVGIADMFAQEMKPIISLYKTLNKPDIQIIADFAGRVLELFLDSSANNEPIDFEKLQRKFEGTSSLVIPASTIKQAAYGQHKTFKKLRYIKITTTDNRSIIVCPDSEFEAQQAMYWKYALVPGWIPNPLAEFKLRKEKWHPEFLEMLENIARRNR